MCEVLYLEFITFNGRIEKFTILTGKGIKNSNLSLKSKRDLPAQNYKRTWTYLDINSYIKIWLTKFKEIYSYDFSLSYSFITMNLGRKPLTEVTSTIQFITKNSKLEVFICLFVCFCHF